MIMLDSLSHAQALILEWLQNIQGPSPALHGLIISQCMGVVCEIMYVSLLRAQIHAKLATSIHSSSAVILLMHDALALLALPADRASFSLIYTARI